MKVYSVNNQEDTNTGSSYFATLKEARACAKATAASGYGCVIEWSEVETPITKARVAELLNNEGWATGNRGTVERWEPNKLIEEHTEVFGSDTYTIKRVDVGAEVD